MSEEIEPVEQSGQNLEPLSPTLAKMKMIEEVGKLHFKGYSLFDIRELTGLNPATIKKYVEEYKGIIQHVANEDPYFLENTQYNTLRVMAELDEVGKEAWESVDIATREGQLNARGQAIKLALDVVAKRAQLFQLLTGNQTDTEYIARMQKAETVNQLISQVIRDVVSECEHCRDRARPMLEEAFNLMNEDSFMDGEEARDNLNIQDAEVIEDDEATDDK
jgi:hypothetical protein